jgi:glycolate oxidase FAD binding subunit
MTSHDASGELQEIVGEANTTKTPLAIRGGGSKGFFGRSVAGTIDEVWVGGHQGVVNYEPTELVLTARAGTPLHEIESVLAEAGQMLPFEPPHFGPKATLGGTLACGLSGPRRPYAGAARDFILGTRILNSRGEALSFGGEVMKNVAGYDVSRLMVGALGTLGILLEASLKVLPKPAQELTLEQELTTQEAIATMNAWACRPLPVSAACYDGERLYVRLSGAPAGVRAARTQVGGEQRQDGEAFWAALREHTQPFFSGATPLWRISVPALTPPLAVSGSWLLDWGGAQRWLRTEERPETIRRAATDAGGHATLFRGGDRTGEVFHPLAPGLARLHRQLKSAFDPNGLFNPQRMYRDW